MRTCVTPEKRFVFSIHKPSYSVTNLRSRTRLEKLGMTGDDSPVLNHRNYPEGSVEVPDADWIYEIANPFPFRGTTYIGKAWADRSAEDPSRIKLAEPPPVSLHGCFNEQRIDPEVIAALPRPLLLGLATTSTDPDDLVLVARKCCRFTFSADGQPTGLQYEDSGGHRALIDDFDLFEAVANNPHLPDVYKIAMVVRPGAQGGSEIVGDYHAAESTHVYEYLRRNSYIGGGHYAANMADDAIRYQIDALTPNDLAGLRHLYYQRSFTRLAGALDISIPEPPLTKKDLEIMRQKIQEHPELDRANIDATLWGWNFGFDFSSSGYRLHASHQQIHQQYAMIPSAVGAYNDGSSDSAGACRSFSAGDMIDEVIHAYHTAHQSSFFNDYYQATVDNKRMDGRTDREQRLVVWEDDRVILFVPKAQTSQWELQVMTRPDRNGRFVGNILEADTDVRHSLDTAILAAQRALSGRGAEMVTTIEYSKRFSSTRNDQPLIYCFMPKLPFSPGAFSETQLRFINGHFPEDFAAACRGGLALDSK